MPPSWLPSWGFRSSNVAEQLTESNPLPIGLAPASARLYAEQLLHCGMGFPLWNPEPDSYVISPGDMGYIRHFYTKSHVQHLLMLKTGTVVSFGFSTSCFVAKRKNISDSVVISLRMISEDLFLMEFLISTNSCCRVLKRVRGSFLVKITSRQASAWNSRGSVFIYITRSSLILFVFYSGLTGAKISLLADHGKGAVLFTDDHVSYDMKQPFHDDLKDYLIDNLDIWKTFLKETMHDRISLSDLVTITGCCRAKSWERATLDQNKCSMGLEWE